MRVHPVTTRRPLKKPGLCGGSLEELTRTMHKLLKAAALAGLLGISAAALNPGSANAWGWGASCASQNAGA